VSRTFNAVILAVFEYLDSIQFDASLALRIVMNGFDKMATHTQGTGFGVVVDENRRCIGVITDGDIRRALMSGASIEAPVSEVMTRDFVFAGPGESSHQILRLFDKRVRHIPVIDTERHLIDLLQFSSFNASARAEKSIIRARAPVRISFGGGGTDMSFYFSDRIGYVLSTTINKFCYASVTVRSDFRTRLISRDFHEVQEYDNIGQMKYGDCLDLVKACAKAMEPPFGFDLETYSEIEPGTGLGGSAAISAAIVGAFNHFRNENYLDRYQLADLAYQAERIELGVPGGWQDQYASVFGGLNLIEFRKEEIIVLPLRVPEDVMLELHFNLLLFRIGGIRDSGQIVRDQQQRFDNLKNALVAKYDQLTRLTINMKDELLKGALKTFGKMLDDAWQIKKEFSNRITNAQINTLYDRAKKAGALGGKMLGAGEGGYLMLYCESAQQPDVIAAMGELGVQQERFEFVDTGLQTWATKASL